MKDLLGSLLGGSQGMFYPPEKLSVRAHAHGPPATTTKRRHWHISCNFRTFHMDSPHTVGAGGGHTLQIVAACFLWPAPATKCRHKTPLARFRAPLSLTSVNLLESTEMSIYTLHKKASTSAQPSPLHSDNSMLDMSYSTQNASTSIPSSPIIQPSPTHSYYSDQSMDNSSVIEDMFRDDDE
ncbi:unnamed protein product [Parnassius apollo]|uniref:(apollo) hypothetical protein n=1 Tax=Parnassius apollo TaxID=110799 RepID=A0A8S3W3R6_PARAO|nr:unnamed protein product [Parnassius apollo]